MEPEFSKQYLTIFFDLVLIRRYYAVINRRKIYVLSALKCKNYRKNKVQDLKNAIQPSLDPLAVNATYAVWIKSESYYEQIPGWLRVQTAV